MCKNDTSIFFLLMLVQLKLVVHFIITFNSPFSFLRYVDIHINLWFLRKNTNVLPNGSI